MNTIDLEWNVYYEEINSRKILTFNIFEHYAFLKGCAKAAEQPTILQFATEVKHELMYYFWSKCEWEILLTSWTAPEDRQSWCKIDVYNQVMLNFEPFINYLWLSREELKKINTKG